MRASHRENYSIQYKEKVAIKLVSSIFAAILALSACSPAQSQSPENLPDTVPTPSEQQSLTAAFLALLAQLQTHLESPDAISPHPYMQTPQATQSRYSKVHDEEELTQLDALQNAPAPLSREPLIPLSPEEINLLRNRALELINQSD